MKIAATLIMCLKCGNNFQTWYRDDARFRFTVSFNNQ